MYHSEYLDYNLLRTYISDNEALKKVDAKKKIIEIEDVIWYNTSCNTSYNTSYNLPLKAFIYYKSTFHLVRNPTND